MEKAFIFKDKNILNKLLFNRLANKLKIISILSVFRTNADRIKRRITHQDNKGNKPK